MLQGIEGIGVYVSDWHRDVPERSEKFIAHAPVRLNGPAADSVWSVAVVAPVVEIEGLIHGISKRHLLLQALIILLILLGSAIVVVYEFRWSKALELEVSRQTEDLRRYARELERSEANYRSLIDGAEDLIFTLDKAGKLVMVNLHTARIFGLRKSDMIEQCLYSLIPMDQAETQSSLIRETFRSGLAKRTETLLNIRDKDFWFNIQYLPLKSVDAGDELILAVARDITERKSLEKQLVNVEKLASLGTLAAGVAHEINNPLGIMLGFCELLLEKIEPGTIEYDDIKTIERQGLQCKEIIERLLSFARMSEEMEDYCDIADNIRVILSIIVHTLDINNIELVTDLSPELPKVKGDSKEIQQVFLNLINNAIYAMNGHGALTVRTNTTEDNR
jgi:PAS domain S-box-containing protein